MIATLERNSAALAALREELQRLLPHGSVSMEQAKKHKAGGRKPTEE